MPVAINDSGTRSGSATPSSGGNNGNNNNNNPNNNNSGSNSVSKNSNSNNNPAANVNVNMSAAATSPPPGPGPGPSRPTTTSRRGGRSRSPVAAVGTRVPSNSNPPAEGENPSSAAAAAAAAAKAYSSGRAGGSGQPWPPESVEEFARRGGPPPPGYPGGPPPSMWPGEEGAYPPTANRGPPMPPHPRGPPYPPPGYGERLPPFTGRDMDFGGEHHRRYHPRDMPPRYDDRGARYGGPPGPPPPSRSGMMQYPPPPADYRYHHHHHRGGGPLPPMRGGPPYPPPDQQPPHSRGGGSSRPYPLPSHRDGPMQQQHRGGGGTTTLVIGGATPIHLPKSPVVSSKVASSSTVAKKARTGSAASVFRGRPEAAEGGAVVGNSSMAAAAAAAAAADDDDDDDSPQKILLSLRTPTTSFEDNKNKKMSPPDSLSPSVPPGAQRSPEQLFETQRSGQLSKSGSIDMAPSFNLFNQSFDSFGDGHYFNVEGSLHADSFGLGRTDSVGAEAGAQILRKNSSTNFSSQFLAPSGSGALTIGYSPVNSFGNVSTAHHQQQQQQQRNGNNSTMMVVGGPDGRSASPSEVLGMYAGNARPLDDSHLRMSVGSFGGHSMSGYMRGSSYEASPNYFNRSPEGFDSRMPLFYVLLRKYRHAFKDCTFLLPGVKSALQEDAMEQDGADPSGADAVDGAAKGAKWDPSQMKSMPGQHPYSGMPLGMYGELTPEDTAVAQRRVESSVCAFGGNINKERSTPPSGTGREAIFRGKEADEHKSAAVTPSSTEASGSVMSQSIQKMRKKYEEDLPNRYYENESRLSWEFEENPPVELSPIGEEEEDEEEETADVKMEGDGSSPQGEHESREGNNDNKTNAEGDQYCQSVSEGDAASTGTGDDKPGGSVSSNQAKMRYRCKLCGQPKQNHRCPYQQSLARSIGCMVYPAVNAFTADEPGTIAAPLSEMNNFVDIQKDDISPPRPTPDRLRHMSGPLGASAQAVTPESLRSSGGGPPSPMRSAPNQRGLARHGMAASTKKRMYSKMQGSATEQGDLLFVESMELKPEQFRSVTQFKSRKSACKPYVYASLPLPYAQRKRLSDNLFSLSNEVPKLTDECAQVLREAREKDMWDLAVAELMTQVIVIIHCSDRDHRFEGLRQYLLTLGIAC